ncbi:cysteine hydrolase family protein [Mycolicibacterium hippocampi]|uniref:Isochorismatase n=1 Tax=Mycolicibacterium hippocampi TaxID=659824 RepID=A0A7I9ZH81_9MYCO|nr:isochorismatase family cysteine hydrolase [Mycolicibacterium hippocampi]GFH00219.1 isochorismatase [Mycolicibacterium hippocampi]
MPDTAVLVIDMMNTYRHPDAELLIPNVADIIDPLAALITRARDRDDVDLIYVNDNYGDFTAQPSDLVQSALQGERPDLVKPVAPQSDFRFVSKVRHSAFYASPLAYLLSRLSTKRVILTGQVTEQCILYSALDAYIRHFDVIVPRDAVAHIDSDLGQAALRMMESNMGAELVDAADCLN